MQNQWASKTYKMLTMPNFWMVLYLSHLNQNTTDVLWYSRISTYSYHPDLVTGNAIWLPRFFLFLSCKAQSDIQTVEHIPRQWAYAMPSRWVCAEHACLGRAQIMCWLKPTGPGIVLRSCFLCLHVKAPLSLWSITAGAKHRPLELARGKYAACTPRLQREAIMIAEERKKWSEVRTVSLKWFIMLPWFAM